MSLRQDNLKADYLKEDNLKEDFLRKKVTFGGVQKKTFRKS